MARHTVHLQNEIDKIKSMILSLGTTIEEAMRNAVISLTMRNTRLAMEVIDGDQVIDQKEVDIEEECLKALALHQPVANDLRLIVAVLKINNDLERIGDLAVNIAERAVFLSTRDPVEIPFDLSSMAHKTELMLKKSLDSFIKLDTQLAREVLVSDDEVDAMNREVYQRIEQAALVYPQNLNCLIQLLSASKYLERAADHTTNIAEDVIYLVEGVNYSPPKIHSLAIGGVASGGQRPQEFLRSSLRWQYELEALLCWFRILMLTKACGLIGTQAWS